jgi:2-polyprenyl-3-methyl-5-hydroxy-6-metoxy-1,4-benzoquinol methylase
MRTSNQIILSPLTGLEDVTWIATTPVDGLKSRWLQEMQVDISADLQGVSAVELYRCNQTDLQFFWPMRVAGGAGFYESLQRSSSNYYPKNKLEFRLALADLNGAKKVLEVGCGTGAFMDLIQQCGITSEGIELNESAASIARDRGHKVDSLDLASYAEQNVGRFDAVCAFQVLEHVAAPREFLGQLLSLLKPGGRLLIGVPNAAGCLRHDPHHILDIPPHHVTRWSTETFYALEKILPLRVLRVSPEPLARYHVRWYLSVITRRTPGLAGHLLYACSLLTLFPLLVCVGAVRRRILGHTLYVCAEHTA